MRSEPIFKIESRYRVLSICQRRGTRNPKRLNCPISIPRLKRSREGMKKRRGTIGFIQNARKSKSMNESESKGCEPTMNEHLFFFFPQNSYIAESCVNNREGNKRFNHIGGNL